MHWTASLDTPHPAATLFAQVDHLDGYPAWLDLVARAEPVGAGVWQVDLRGRIGPLARSKRLRMVRTVHEPPGLVVFERRENDGRRHSMWELRGEVHPTGSGSRLDMHLTYDGSLLAPLIEQQLASEIERARPRLLALLDAR